MGIIIFEIMKNDWNEIFVLVSLVVDVVIVRLLATLRFQLRIAIITGRRQISATDVTVMMNLAIF